jgi:hypothetical protein
MSRFSEDLYEAIANVDEREFLNLSGYGGIALLRLCMTKRDNSLTIGDCSRQITLDFSMWGDVDSRNNVLHKITRLYAQVGRLKRRLEKVAKIEATLEERTKAERAFFEPGPAPDTITAVLKPYPGNRPPRRRPRRRRTAEAAQPAAHE